MGSAGTVEMRYAQYCAGRAVGCAGKGHQPRHLGISLPHLAACRVGARHVRYGHGPRCSAGGSLIGGRVASMRILVVEDDAKVGGFLEQGLREENYEVGRGHDGEQAIAMALDEQYDLILLDYMLPKRSGPQVVQALRAQGRSVPVLMLTARDSPEDIRLCLTSGANAYLTKPFRFADLLDHIHRLTGSSVE